MSWSYKTLCDYDITANYDTIFNQELSIEKELMQSQVRREKAKKSTLKKISNYTDAEAKPPLLY